MRPTLTLTLILMFLVVASCFSCQKKQEKKTWDPDQAELVIIEVTGDSGGVAWASEIKAALEKVPNTFEVKVLFPKRQARMIIKKGSYNEAQIRSALQVAGFGMKERLK